MLSIPNPCLVVIPMKAKLPMLRHIVILGLVVMGSWIIQSADVRAEASTPATVIDSRTEGAATELHLSSKGEINTWTHDEDILGRDEGDIVEMQPGLERTAKTIKLENLVPPIHFGLGRVDIPDSYLAQLRDVLENMRERENVRLHFVGHADNLPLVDELKTIYGDNYGLSRERAGTVAEYCQQALGLPPDAISYGGRGDSRPVADNDTEEGRRLNRRVEVEVWYDEITEKEVEKEVIIPRHVKRVKVCRSETVCKLRYLEGHEHRARVRNMIMPMHYDREQLELPEPFLNQMQQALNHLADRLNVVVKLIAYTDDSPLTERQKRIYGDQLGLSKAVARRVSLMLQESLGLPNQAIDSEGRGASRPVATNGTQQGRFLNRRVEVEFWYDDPLQQLPDEPQICPDTDEMEMVTRVYQPAETLPSILFEQGKPVIPEGLVAQLQQIMNRVADKTNVRLRFTGYTGDTRLNRRTAAIYKDDIGLSMARARRAMAVVGEQMGLSEDQTEFDGRGYVHSADIINAGFVESDVSHVAVQVAYDEPAILDDWVGIDVSPVTREVTPVTPFSLNQMRITVDGQPLDDPGKCSSDVQRCTDVALEEADIQFKYDSLTLEPRLNITAWPRSIRYQDKDDTGQKENRVLFRLYANYRSFIDRAEVRIFDAAQSVHDLPLAVVAMDTDGRASWLADFKAFKAPVRKLKYTVRVYDDQGVFDETEPQPLWVVDRIHTPAKEDDVEQELLAGYGESRIALQNIPLHGGTVKAFGKSIPPGHGVWMAGFEVPIDGQGRFVSEEIIPEGIHTVEVAVLDQEGNGELFLRDLELKKRDWFTVGLADLTLSGNKTNGPARLLSPDNPNYSEDFSLQGRMAFYTSGRFKNGWALKASADTEEGPVEDIFSNFLDKSPEALFRRMDPDRHYPTFGDDSVVEEDAPTSGKFYVRLEKEKTYGMWGNSEIDYTDTELAQVDRGLYGANLHFEPSITTGFGQPRLMVDAFAADPGTIAGRDSFRGTDGSLYLLRHQDILTGSDRLRIEVRDKDSGMVIAVKNLIPVIDYDIDYIQGRILLSEPLPATATDDLLVHSSPISGNPVFLVARYEYTPTFTETDTLAIGGRVHYWFNDHIKIGLTGDHDKQGDMDNNLAGADLTLRRSAETWVKIEAGRTTGAGTSATTSADGGYFFNTIDGAGDENTEASAYRLEGSVSFDDVHEGTPGKTTFYYQNMDSGYSSPAWTTDQDTTQLGATVDSSFGDQVDGRIKFDRQMKDSGLNTLSGELNLDYGIGDHWTLSSGVRHDSRQDESVSVPDTQEEGDRTDAVVQLHYDSHTRWTTYGFLQDTVSKTGNRQDNGRVGIGGSMRLTERFNILVEASGGDLGAGGRLGTEYLYSDRTKLYLNYSLENDQSDNGLRVNKGTMTTGVRTRYSDSASVYYEEKYSHGDVPTGLLHSTGMALSPSDRLNFGANLDIGTLADPVTAAEIERRAVGVSAGYGFDRLTLTNALEYRFDNTERPGEIDSERTTWLFKNSFKYKLSPDWRILGKLNHALSDSSMGEFYDGDFTEAVLGYAYRPTRFDRLNALFKYTYFYNRPASDQTAILDSTVIQRSHIAAVDVMYDLTSRWTLGGKYAYRHGQVAYDRNDPDFFDSRAHLFVLRADWHFLYRWDALVEGRRLDLPDARDSRDGILFALYRHFGKHVKLGVGYNFCDFSDDLTQMHYDYQGFFINLIGKM